MHRLLRILTLWLLSLALPINGMAAQAWLHGAPLPAQAAQAAAEDQADCHQARHDASGSHGGMASASLHAGTPDGAAPHAGGKHACNACSLHCCAAAAALPSALAVLASQQAARAAPSVPAALHVAFVTGGPERPPRRSLPA